MPPIVVVFLLLLFNILLPQSAQAKIITNTLRRTICLCGRRPAFDIRGPAQREWQRLNEAPKHLDPKKPDDLSKLVQLKGEYAWELVPPPAAIRNEEITAYYYRFDYYAENLNRTMTFEVSCNEDECLRPKAVAKRHCAKFKKKMKVDGKTKKYGTSSHKMCYTTRWRPDLDAFRLDMRRWKLGGKERPTENDELTNKTCGKECGERFNLDVVLGPRNWWSIVDLWKIQDFSQWTLVRDPPPT